MKKSIDLKHLEPMRIVVGEVETAHLQLRQPVTEDFSVLSNLWRNKKVRQFLGRVVSDEEIEAKIVSVLDHWNKHGFGQFAILNKITKQIIGVCGLVDKLSG